jgi:hypothetical protein
MSSPTKIGPDEQLKRFKQTARELGCDEDKGRFEKALGKIVRYKPKERGSPSSKRPKDKKPAK